MAYPIPERNKRISTLIKWFVERKKGKVVESRQEIQQRFESLDWSDQKKIILAFLSSGKADRLWIYPHLLKYWDDEFIPIVKEVFEKYHEDTCKWAIIRYFPTNYLLENIGRFSEGRDYYFLCRRLAYDKVAFVIEKEKLSPRDYLTILIDRNETLKDDKALDVLFSVLHDITTNVLSEFDGVNRRHFIEKGHPFVASDFAYIYILTQQLTTLGCRKAVEDFEEWNHRLYKTIEESAEFKKLNEASPSDYSQKRRKIAKRYIYRLLPDKYKLSSDQTPYATNQEIMERLMEQNPNIEELIEKFGLEFNEG